MSPKLRALRVRRGATTVGSALGVAYFTVKLVVDPDMVWPVSLTAWIVLGFAVGLVLLIVKGK